MLKIRRPLGRLIFNMGIAIPGKTVFLNETAPWWRMNIWMNQVTIVTGDTGRLFGSKPLIESILTLLPSRYFGRCVHHRHDDVIKWKHIPRYWLFVRGIHRSPANSPHKGQCRRALIFSLICAWISGWENNREAGDLRRHRDHNDVNVLRTRLMTQKQ